MQSKENTHSYHFSYNFMAEGCLSSQVILPFSSNHVIHFLYCTIIPVYPWNVIINILKIMSIKNYRKKSYKNGKNITKNDTDN